MIDHIKRCISFVIENRKKDGAAINKNVPIRMIVRFQAKRIDFVTGYRVDSNKWDGDKQLVKNGAINKDGLSASEINQKLRMQANAIEKVFNLLEEKGEYRPSVDIVKKLVLAEIDKAKTVDEIDKVIKKTDIASVFSEFVETASKEKHWSASTKEKFHGVKMHIEDFARKHRLACPSDFKTKELKQYVDFLQDDCDMCNRTISKQVGFLKWFLRWAFSNGYSNNKDFDLFKPKLKVVPKKVIFLTPDELKKLENCYIPDTQQYLARTRDVFLFCCYTSFRYSDAYNLRKSDIKNGHIEITTIKTADSIRIPLNNDAKAILAKYQDIPFEYDKALPVVSNQKMNDYLQILCKMAEIDDPVHETYYQGEVRMERTTPKWQLISTHAARRTFICRALSLGIPPQIVMKWTGHSDYKAMKPYIDIADQDVDNAMNLFNIAKNN